MFRRINEDIFSQRKIMVILLSVFVCSWTYWSDPHIHNLGNVGFMGAVHASLAPLSTHIIDSVAYDGMDLRKEAHRYAIGKNTSSSRVVDLCCGVGYSTLQLGVDTSHEMLAMAEWIQHGSELKFVQGNAESWGDDDAYDIATCYFATHEMPRKARHKVLRNMLRIARKCIVVDIAPTYEPSELMLKGEPYILDYLKHMDEDIFRVALKISASEVRKEVLIPNHAVLWSITR